MADPVAARYACRLKARLCRTACWPPCRPDRAARAEQGRSCARQSRSTPLRPVAGHAVSRPGHTTANTPSPRTSLYFRRSC
jgi:hypothetical protein